MTIQINSDSSIVLDAAFSDLAESIVAGALERFAHQISRVEVHLSDTNKGKGGDQDKRCVLEARVSGREPVAVTGEAAELETALRAAAEKMERLLDHQLGRLEARR